MNPKQTRLSLSPWTCSRVILESCANAVWLLSTDIPPEKRVARSLSCLLQDQEELRKYLNCIEKHDPTTVNDTQHVCVKKRAQDRLRNLESDAHTMNITPNFNKKGKLIGFGNEQSSALDRITSTLGPDVEERYRSYSAIVHASGWATLALGAKVDPQSGKKAAIEEMSPSHAMSMVALSMSFFALAALNHFRLFGWDAETLKRILDTAYSHARPTSSD